MAAHGRKQLARPARLKAAKRWLRGYRGKHVVRAYRRWFGVSEVCAIVELGMIGVDLPAERLEQARRDERGRAAGRARRTAEREAARTRRFAPFVLEAEDELAFMAAYTESGPPYGIRRDQLDLVDADRHRRQPGPDGSDPGASDTDGKRKYPPRSGEEFARWLDEDDEDTDLPF